jgi:hypothetical protein
MSSTITITVDEKGQSIIGKLPPGVFCSCFPAPPDAQIRDVISINAAGLYTIQVNGPDVANPSATAPVEVLGLQKSQVSFLVDASDLPLLQEYGTASCQVGEFSYTLGVIVMSISLYLLLKGNVALEPVVAASSLVTFAGVLIFAWIVWMPAGSGARTTLQPAE